MGAHASGRLMCRDIWPKGGKCVDLCLAWFLWESYLLESVNTLLIFNVSASPTVKADKLTIISSQNKNIINLDDVEVCH